MNGASSLKKPTIKLIPIMGHQEISFLHDPGGCGEESGVIKAILREPFVFLQGVRMGLFIS